MWNKLKKSQDCKVQGPKQTLWRSILLLWFVLSKFRSFFFNTHDMLRNFHFSNHWTYSIIWPPNPSPSLKGWQVAENAVLLTRRKQEKMISYYILPGFSLYPFSIHLLNLLQCAAFFSHNSTLPSLFLKPCRDLLTYPESFSRVFQRYVTYPPPLSVNASFLVLKAQGSFTNYVDKKR